MDLHIPIPNLYMSSSGPTPPDDFDLQMTLSDSPELLFVKSICIELLNLRWLIKDFSDSFRQNENTDEDIFYFLDHFETLYCTVVYFNHLLSTQVVSTIEQFGYILYRNFDNIFKQTVHINGFIEYFYNPNFFNCDIIEPKRRSGGFSELLYIINYSDNREIFINFMLFYYKLLNDLDVYEKNPHNFKFASLKKNVYKFKNFTNKLIFRNPLRNSTRLVTALRHSPYGGKSKTRRKYHSKKQKRVSRHRITQRRRN